MKHIFITGCPRSGTTMLASILGSCKDCVATPESDFFFEINKLRSLTGKLPPNHIGFLNQNYRFKQWGIDANEIQIENRNNNDSDFISLVEGAVQLYSKKYQNMNIDRLTRIDHTPSNIKHFDHLNRMFPQSIFLFIVRDPRAVFASVKSLDWGANTALRLSEIWIEYVALFYSVQKLFPDRILLTKYEDIIENPDEKINEICQFANLEYNANILKGNGFILPKYTASQHQLVGKAPSKTALDKWKSKLSDKDIRIIEAKCSLIMKGLGYNSLFPNNFSVGYRDQLNSFVKEAYSFLANKFKKYKREKSQA